MKQIFVLAFLFSLIQAATAQTIQEIQTGAGYRKQSYINLSAGSEKVVENTSWDIAFTVTGVQDAGIFVNESAGSSMGSPLPQTELYDAQTSNFSDQPDPAALVDFRLYNSEKNWEYGAFNENRDPSNPFDFGWGTYQPMSNQVVGNKVYVVKLRNGQYRKLKIESLTGTTYTFKYANLNGTGEQTKTINKADHAGKVRAYFNLETGAIADVEPATGGFDLLYCRYSTQLWDPGSMTYIAYDVTGILHGRGAQTAEADGVDPTDITFAEVSDSLKTETDVIGHDWKYFSGTAWEMDLDRVFFLKTANNRVWKLFFIDFEGSTTGKTIMEKTDLGTVSAVSDPAALGLQVLTYPNPTVNDIYVALDVPAELINDARLIATDLQGRQVLSQTVALRNGFQVLQLDAAAWTSGAYHLQLQLPQQSITLGKVVKQ